MMEKLIKTDDGQWFVCELRGVCFVTWVHISDKDRALGFPAEKAEQWRQILESWTGLNLIVESGE